MSACTTDDNIVVSRSAHHSPANATVHIPQKRRCFVATHIVETPILTLRARRLLASSHGRKRRFLASVGSLALGQHFVLDRESDSGRVMWLFYHRGDVRARRCTPSFPVEQ